MALSQIGTSVSRRNGFTERNVKITGEYIERLAFEYWRMCERAYPGNAVTFCIEDLTRFLLTSLAIRVGLVRRSMYHDKIRKYDYRAYRIPAYWALVLDGIGEATDYDHSSVVLKPVFDAWDQLMSPEEMSNFMLHLKNYKDIFVLREIPRRSEGRLSTMSRALICHELTNQTLIASYRPECLPSDNMAAIWAGLHLLEEGLHAYYPYDFGQISHYFDKFDLDEDGGGGNYEYGPSTKATREGTNVPPATGREA